MQQPGQGLKPKQVALRAKSADHPGRYLRHIRTMPKCFPSMNVRKMDFDNGSATGAQGITDGDGCVRECRWIYQDRGALAVCFLNPVNQFSLVI